MALAIGLNHACSHRALTSPGVELRARICNLSLHLVGLPYRYSGKEINGFDCSGFVWYIYSCHGIEIPRSAAEQNNRLKRFRVHPSRARPGDILVFRIDRKWHTAVYIETDRFVHAPREGRSVSMETINEYWQRNLKFVISLLPG